MYKGILSSVCIVLSLALASGNKVRNEPDCPYSEEIIFYPDAEDCTKFYECYLGEANVYFCPPDLYWNQDLHLCDYKENVDCDSYTDAPTRPTDAPTDAPTGSDAPTDPNTTEAPTDSTDTPAPEPTTVAPDPDCAQFPPEEIHFLPEIEDCSKYYECFAGTKTEMDCPPGLFWNQELETCDYTCNI